MLIIIMEELLMFDNVKEECGVFGVYSNKPEKLAYMTCIGLSGLQHRGEESCGIAVNTDGVISYHKEPGLVSEVFTNEVLDNLPEGNMSIGHVRYSTTGSAKRENAQPIVIRHKKGNLAVVHNGNITNAIELKQELEDNGAIFTTTSDTEVICHIIVRERLKAKSTEEAIANTMKVLKGSYSLIIMSPQKLIACRDPQGFRPLCMGKLGDDIVFASESCALDICGAEFIRDVLPGEIVTITKDGIKSDTSLCQKNTARCVFEYIYFARPDSKIDGMGVYESRVNAGRILAKTHPVEADLVVGVPESGNPAALGYSMESGIPYGNAFIKNNYVGRTFIKPKQEQRESSVKVKLNVLKEVVAGKRVIMIDDSIVRGTTSSRIINLLRQAGAKEVHVRISSPAFLHPCYFGTDIPSEDQLIASGRTVEEICKEIGADSLGYLETDKLSEMICNQTGFCDACFTGNYPIEPPTIDIRGEMG